MVLAQQDKGVFKMSKTIAYDQKSLDAIKGGVRTLSRAVTRTLGPRGRNVLLQNSYGPPVVACIAENAGQDGSLICEKVAQHAGSYGYNAMTDTFEDLFTTGVIDPTKVVRSEIENAASVATLLLTSDAIIAEKPKGENGGPVMAAIMRCIDTDYGQSSVSGR